MGPERVVFQTWCMIPMIICILMMAFMFFSRGNRGFGLGRFFNQEDTNNTSSSNSALDLLNERYAKGEISNIEYEDIKKQLLKRR